MTHHNNHARSKQKRKSLRQQNTRKRIHDKRLQKIANEIKPKKGKPFKGDAISVAVDIRDLFPTGFDNIFNFGNHHGISLNQRQKRKRARWSNRIAA